MSAGLPLFILSALAVIIIVIWLRYGAGEKNSRVKVASVVLIALAASWLAILSFGVFHPIGSWSMGIGFLVSIAAFFVPAVYNKFQK